MDNEHSQRIYFNILMLANYYDIKSDIFEIFSLAQGSSDEALKYVEELYSDGLLLISEYDYKKLHFALKYTNKPKQYHILANDLIVQICQDAVILENFKSNRTVKLNKLSTGYARNICREDQELEKAVVL
ncbi:MAG: hypothetical protein ISR68_01430 [Campylobacterales bacterium]|nr:hypothetical protein [Campylobacterales bacterium]